jgi:CHAT domain-containing protein
MPQTFLSNYGLQTLGTVLLLVCVAHMTVAQQANAASAGVLRTSHQTAVQKLEVGKPIAGELKGGESHSFEITLEAGHFVTAVVEQRGIDVVVQVIAQGGRQLMEIDSPNGTKGNELVEFIAEAPGVYSLKVNSFETKAAAGKYEIRVMELRASTEKDRALIEKNRLLQDATNLAAEAESLRMKGNYDAALPIAERALAIREQALGAAHPLTAQSLNNLALLFYAKGEYGKAEPLLIRSLAISEQAFGAAHPLTATTLNNLASFYQQMGDYAKAEPHFIRAQAISEQALGAAHPSTATALNNLAALYRDKGDYEKAEPLYIRSYVIYEKALGASNPSTATSLNNLAALYQEKGDYAKAEPHFIRALAIYEQSFGATHPLTATALNNLAALYREKGDYVKAEPLYIRTLAINEQTLGAAHPSTALSLNNLALLYYSKSDFEKAELLYVRSLAIREQTLGAAHPSTAQSLNNLAALYQAKSESVKAGPLLIRALAINEQALGANHPSTAISLNNLAALYREKGDYARAEPLYRRALAINEQTLGAAHPSTTTALNNLASFYQQMGDDTKAIAFQIRASETDERDLVRNLTTGSGRQKIAYLNRNSQDTDFILSLHIQSAPNNMEIRRAALTRLLRRKGRALDAMTETVAVLRRHASPDDQALLDQLAETRSQYSRLVNNGAGRDRQEQYRARLKALEDREEQLENDISGRGIELRTQLLPITLEAVQKAIPKDAALLEFATYRPYDSKARRYGAGRYVAYLLTNQGEIAHADIGEAAAIEQIVANWRKALRQRSSDIDGSVKPLARQLDEKIMRPVRTLLGDKRRLLVSPDGALNLIPFDALVDENGHYLVEHYFITYLTSGRDLLRLQMPKPVKQSALLLAAPDFDRSVEIAKTDTNDKSRILERFEQPQGDNKGLTHQVSSRPGPRLGRVQLQPLEALPGSAKEGKKVKKILKGSTLLTGAEATEAVLKGVSSPSILHISTHGGFLENQPGPVLNQQRGLRIRPTGAVESTEWVQPRMSMEEPLLRSGLFFAGANTGNSGKDDGVLTALEAIGLDLYGTRLVILSACDTGVGEVKNGDGVYGLRRAFVLAGAETQVMSLWPVSDEGTQKLMVAYYERLRAGKGRGEALRHVQLNMLGSKTRKHPFFWASFIQSGEWANLRGKR